MMGVRFVGLAAATFLACLAGCGPDPAPVVATRAAWDLSCPEAQVRVQEGGECTYYARGCGKKAAYIVRPEAQHSAACCPPIGCDAILSGPISEDQSTDANGVPTIDSWTPLR